MRSRTTPTAAQTATSAARTQSRNAGSPTGSHDSSSRVRKNRRRPAAAVRGELDDLAGDRRERDRRSDARRRRRERSAGRAARRSCRHRTALSRRANVGNHTIAPRRPRRGGRPARVMVGALVGGPSQASGAARSTVLLSHGDTARVADVPVGCLVVRRGVPPATMLDCRRAGPLAGTYGVLLGRWNVRVVRFRSAREAQVVFTATHGGRSVCCTGSRP